MVRCPKCGEVVSVTKKYCIACGVRLKGGGGNRELGLTLIVSGIVLIAISAGLAIIN